MWARSIRLLRSSKPGQEPPKPLGPRRMAVNLADDKLFIGHDHGAMTIIPMDTLPDCLADLLRNGFVIGN